jgi:polar amino acid transport system substrate-binding protein
MKLRPAAATTAVTTAVTTAAALAFLGIAATACGTTTATPSTAPVSCTPSAMQNYLYQKGRLTVATDSPAYWPWFYRNRPTDGKGYESAVAYGVAKELGFKRSQVKWVVEPFNASYAPGPKHFDFDINEISVTTARAKEVTFSTGYYNVNQSLVALKGTPIVKKHTPAELKTYVFGDQIGTTSLAFIDDKIRPTHTPAIFDTLNDVKSALQDHRIAALVADTPTAQYIAADEIPHAVLLAQFPSTGEHYGLLFAKGDKLAVCVDHAIATLKADGFLAKKVHRYLQLYTQVPIIKP